MSQPDSELAALADHLQARRESILYEWRRVVKQDPALTTANALPRAQLNDHIPALLTVFERKLDAGRDAPAQSDADGAQAQAVAHGLHRWQQGYGLAELARELGHLNQCIVRELDAYAGEHPELPNAVMASARCLWAELSALEFSESISEYHRLQQTEAAGHVRDLEQALSGLRELERERAALWHEAAHDLRGNFGVVANVAQGLTRSAAVDPPQARFLHFLDRSVKSLHLLLDDVTDLARLQAGKERVRIATFDVAEPLSELCAVLQDRAGQQGLFLDVAGPSPFEVDGDAVKIRRIAQNLVLNAIKYTPKGGITVSWGDSAVGDGKRWMLCVQDSGPGFDAGPSAPLVASLEAGTDLARDVEAGIGSVAPLVPTPVSAAAAHAATSADPAAPSGRGDQGEGIGLSIVKRLCELLHASVEVDSRAGVGTAFKVFFPKRYSAL